jgi:hypothetical protein
MANLNESTVVTTIGRRVKHDARGTASFDWEVSTGVLRTMSKDNLLDALTGTHLALADDLKMLRAIAANAGYDPYNRGR